MKYKNLKSFVHNFVHSFVSYTNYIDNGYVIDDLLTLGRKEITNTITLSWVPKEPISSIPLSERVYKSIEIFHEWLDKHAKSHQIDLKCILELRLELFRKESGQFAVFAIAKDDKNKVTKVPVSF